MAYLAQGCVLHSFCVTNMVSNADQYSSSCTLFDTAMLILCFLFFFLFFPCSTISACVTDMVMWHKVSTATDPYFAEWTVSVTTQIIQCSCLVCTCVLYLRNFLSSVETGFGLNVDLSASIPLKPRATVGYSLSSERLTGSASMPGQIQVTTRYEVHAETVHGAG